jgi:CO dehydrogenase nickel-insertion accessory protein CooC1
MKIIDNMKGKAVELNKGLADNIKYNKGLKINFIGTSGSGSTTMAIAAERVLRSSGKCLLVDTDGRHDGLSAYLKNYSINYSGITSILDKLQAGVEWKSHTGKSIAKVRCSQVPVTSPLHDAVLNTEGREDLGRFLKDLVDIYTIKYPYVILDTGFLSNQSKMELTPVVGLNVVVCETSKKSLDILNQYREGVRRKSSHDMRENTVIMLNKVVDDHSFLVAKKNLIKGGWEVLDGPVRLSNKIVAADSLGGNFIYSKDSNPKGKDNPYKEFGQIADYILSFKG